MIALKDNRISIYQGDYRPVEAMRNGQKLAGWKRVGMTGSEGEFTGTYNDALTVYGKSGYRESRNFCPPPEAKTRNDGIIEVVLEPTVNGRFDLSSRTVSNDVAMMMSPNIVHSVTLSAGTYTASSNSVALGLSMGDEMVYSLPHTFTLETDQTVYFGTYSTDFAETDLYLQIESGESVTDYDPYAGDPTKEPSPDNIRPLVAAEGKILIQGKNLFNASLLSKPQTKYGITVEYEGNGTYHLYGQVTSNSSVTPIEFDVALPCEPERKYTASAVLLSGFTEAAFYAYFGIGETLNSSKNFLAAAIPANAVIGKVYARSQTPANVSSVSNPKYITSFWMYFHDQKDKRIDCRVQVWLENTTASTGYPGYYAPKEITIPKLCGIPVNGGSISGTEVEAPGFHQGYIRDVLSNRQLHRYVGQIILDGTEGLYQVETNLSQVNCFSWDMGGVYEKPQTADSGLCNALTTLTTPSEDRMGVLFGNQDQSIYLYLDRTSYPDVTAVKNWLSAQSLSGNPVTFLYRLETPIQEEVTAIESPMALPHFSRIIVSPEGKSPTFELELRTKI